MIIEGPDLFTCWKELNMACINGPDTEGVIIKSMGVSKSLYDITLKASKGFGLPKETSLTKPEKRIALLTPRYIDEDLWDEGIKRLKDYNKPGSMPKALAIQFHRTKKVGDRKRVPKGGGCLLSLVITSFKKGWHIEIFSRAAEMTCTLLGDLYFLQHVLGMVKTQADLKNFEVENIDISWHMTTVHQTRFSVPVFLYEYHGKKGLKGLKSLKTEWGEICFSQYKDMINPEVKKMGTRLMWSKWLVGKGLK